MRQNMTLGGLIGLKLLPSNLHKHKDRNSNLMGAPQPPQTFFFAEYCTSSASTNQKTLYKKRTYNCQFIPTPHICHGSHGYIRVNFFWPV